MAPSRGKAVAAGGRGGEIVLAPEGVHIPSGSRVIGLSYLPTVLMPRL